VGKGSRVAMMLVTFGEEARRENWRKRFALYSEIMSPRGIFIFEIVIDINILYKRVCPSQLKEQVTLSS
jgi:hypothetical protein